MTKQDEGGQVPSGQSEVTNPADENEPVQGDARPADEEQEDADEGSDDTGVSPR